MALTTIDFETTFQYGVAPKTFKFEDKTDYAGQGIALTNVTGVIKIVAPDGSTHYNNTNHSSPDINPDVSLFNSTSITLPLLGDGSVMEGNYSFTYTVRVAADTLNPAYDVLKTKSFDLDYTSPVIDLDMSVDCVKPLLKSTDNTGYTQGSTNPTIVRDHKIHYPATTGAADITGTGKDLQTAVFYTIKNDSLQHSASLTSTLTYDFGGGFFVTDEVSGNGYADVTCDGELCDIFCCLKSKWNLYQNALTTNKTLADKHMSEWHEMMGLASLVKIALECGKGDDVSSYIAKIQDLGNCSGDCSCDDGTPQLVTGLGGANTTTVVESGGTPVIVSSAVAGSVTTYTVSLSSSFVSKVNNSYNSVVAAGTGVSVAVSTAADGTKTYTVTNTQTANVPSQTTMLIEIDSNLLGSLPSVSIVDEQVTGSDFQAATIANDNTPYATWVTNNNSFTLSNFTSSSFDFKPKIQVVKTEFYGGTTGCDVPASFISAEICTVDKTGNGSLTFRLHDELGTIYSGNVIETTWDKILISLTIDR